MRSWVAAALVGASISSIALGACATPNPEVREVAAAQTTVAAASKVPAAMTTASSANTAAAPRISVKDGASGVKPWEGVKVASRSKLLEVTMTNEEGREVDSKFSSDKTEWATAEPLGYGRTYTLKAKNADGKISTSTFTTFAPEQQANVSVGPLEGSTVGIGQAVTFRFSAPVKDRAAVEKKITVETSNDTVGGFFWLDPYELRWRPKDFWEPGTEVNVAAELYGRDLGGGVWGANDVTIDFTIGDAVTAVVDNATKTLTVYRGEEAPKTFPVALGIDGKFDTPNGTYVIGDSHEKLVMDSRSYGLGLDQGGYVTPVDFATQMSYSGIYVHSAPWAASAWGNTNVSHGCINASYEDARWFQQTVRRGDPVIVKNTQGKDLSPYDGLGYWNFSWSKRSGGPDDPHA